MNQPSFFLSQPGRQGAFFPTSLLFIYLIHFPWPNISIQFSDTFSIHGTWCLNWTDCYSLSTSYPQFFNFSTKLLWINHYFSPARLWLMRILIAKFTIRVLQSFPQSVNYGASLVTLFVNWKRIRYNMLINTMSGVPLAEIIPI